MFSVFHEKVSKVKAMTNRISICQEVVVLGMLAKKALDWAIGRDVHDNNLPLH